MNCQAVRNNVLALPDPRHVPDPLRAHVAGCPGCRAWAEQAARLEALLERLPVPPAPADKKAALVDDLTRAAEPAPAGGFVRRNAALVGGLAAAVAVAAGGWWLAGGRPARVPVVQAAPANPFLERVVRRDVELARADTPAKKLRALGGLAEDLSAEARGLARVATPGELDDVARWFGRVVNTALERAENLPVHALPPAERVAEFDALAGKLGGAADEAERLAGEVAPDSKPVLQRIAATARKGQQKLRELSR